MPTNVGDWDGTVSATIVPLLSWVWKKCPEPSLADRGNFRQQSEQQRSKSVSHAMLLEIPSGITGLS
jgi:hypothetical protein